ncbi:ankyrin repeat domain-containing protein 30B-like [Rhinopithecus roxellana]|uniref:ankyrin repeat domain-containing protein 30B-like n=1 Tax=Rhinopithecus roxellana TaxID=61622 RepID=UPI0012373304|nr:ankyrin repeat domain-containing protein 30B-like [Rhinopithecus roxellana]
MFQSGSKQKDDKEDHLDFESFLENLLQNDECLPKDTHRKELDTKSGKLRESSDKDGLLQPTGGMKASNPNKALELKDRETFKAAQKFPSESKEKDDKEDHLDFESFLEDLLQNDVYLPTATHQKEFDTISGKPQESSDKDGLLQPTSGMKASNPNKALELKDRETFKAAQKFPSESKEKDDKEDHLDFESFLEDLLQNDVYLPMATHQKEFDTISGKLEESSDKDGLLQPTCGMKVSIPNQALELKDRETFKAVDMSSVEPISSLFGKLTTETSQSPKVEEDFNLATKIISVNDTQNYVCLPEATDQKEIKTIYGKIEESPEKPSDFEVLSFVILS